MGSCHFPEKNRGMPANEKEIPIKKRMTMKQQTTEGSSLVWRAKLVFTNPIDQEASTLVSQLLLQQESQENRSAEALCKFCSEYFPNSLARILLEVYRCSIDKPKIASKSISLLRALLTRLRSNKISLSRFALPFIQPLLISCLLMPRTKVGDVKILSRILFLVAAEVLESDNHGWDELSICIASVADHDLHKAFAFFRDLPPLYEGFMLCILQRLFPKILTLLNLEDGNAKDWRLVLQTGFKMAIQLLDTARSDLVGNISYAILKSAKKLVTQEKEEILQQGLEELGFIIREYKHWYNFDHCQYEFVLELASMMERMKGAGEKTKMAAMKINQITNSW